MVELADSGGHATPQDIEALESEVGLLPEDYRRFLMDWNGGQPVLDTLTFEMDGRTYVGGVDVFLGLTNGPYTSLRRYLADYAGRIPPGTIPIAYDPGGNLFLLCLTRDTRFGEVWFWDHEREGEEGEPARTDNVFPVRGSFDDFLSSLADEDSFAWEE